MSLVIACGCIFNNVIDRDIDSLMERTKNRVLVRGLMSPGPAIIYGMVLGVLGLFVLYKQTNLLTLTIAVSGLFIYVVAYSLWLKRTSTIGTLIGAISGAVPPVVGYCAVSNQLDAGAIILFMMLFFWQMPHFYAISISRLKDYSAASIPILPLVKNVRYTKISMLIYTILFAIAAVMPSVFGYTGVVYLSVALIIDAIWLLITMQGFTTQNDTSWARKTFAFSILAITVLSFTMAVKF